jgi:hypothetical protein
MHCSGWRFVGDPDDLEQRYLALMKKVPESNHVLHERKLLHGLSPCR